MSAPVLQLKDLVHSELDPNMYYKIGRGPDQDFDLEVGGFAKVRMTPSRGFVDRGAKCSEWRAADWMDYTDWKAKLYVRFYHA